MAKREAILVLAKEKRNKPFVLPESLGRRTGAGIWCLQYNGRNMFQEEAFGGLNVCIIIEGLAQRGAKLLQVHEADLKLSVRSSQTEISQVAHDLVLLCGQHGIAIEGVTSALFGPKFLAGGATTAIADDVWEIALAKVLKTIDLAAAINQAITGLTTKQYKGLVYKRVRELIGWPGGEEVGWLVKSFPYAFLRRIRHIANIIKYAEDRGVAVEGCPLWISEEPKPWEPARQIVVGTTMAGLLMMKILQQLLPPRLRKIVKLGVNPEVAHENMSFEVYYQLYELAASLGMLTCVHLNGVQARGVHDLDLAAARRECFNVLFALRHHPNIPIILDVKPDRTDLARAQRWRCFRHTLLAGLIIE